jgi:hypothetical protein
MQKKAKAQRAGLEIDGLPYPGLNELSPLKVVKGELNADYPGGSETIADGQQKWDPITGSYLDRADSDIASVMFDWFSKNELHDVTYIEYDGHGTEIRRWLIPDCECTNYENSPWNAGGVEVAKVKFKFVFDNAILQ